MKFSGILSHRTRSREFKKNIADLVCTDLNGSVMLVLTWLFGNMDKCFNWQENSVYHPLEKKWWLAGGMSFLNWKWLLSDSAEWYRLRGPNSCPPPISSHPTPCVLSEITIRAHLCGLQAALKLCWSSESLPSPPSARVLGPPFQP